MSGIMSLYPQYMQSLCPLVYIIEGKVCAVGSDVGTGTDAEHVEGWSASAWEEQAVTELQRCS